VFAHVQSVSLYSGSKHKHDISSCHAEVLHSKHAIMHSLTVSPGKAWHAHACSMPITCIANCLSRPTVAETAFSNNMAELHVGQSGCHSVMWLTGLSWGCHVALRLREWAGTDGWHAALLCASLCCMVGFDPTRGLPFMTFMQGLALGCFFHKEKTLLFLCCNGIFLCCDV